MKTATKNSGEKHAFVPEMITIRFAGWISGRIVSLQPDTDIPKLLSNVNRVWIRIAQSFIYYFHKHSAICAMTPSLSMV